VTAKITLTWDNGSSEHVDQVVYRSAETFTVDNLPLVLARVGRNAREYIDTAIVTGNVYFYAVASENAVGEILLSSVISVAAGESDGDPHWDKVMSLLHFDGDLTDETGRIWDQLGAPIIGGAGRFGGCITFSGSPSERLTTAHQAFGVDDWTVEMWIKFSLTSGQQNFFENLNSAGINPSGRFTIYQAAASLRVFINSADRISTPVPSTNTWHHLSVSCESGLVRLFVDGAIKGSWNSGGLNFDQTLTIFGAGFGTDSLFGSLDEFRITKGVARYIENFTPPTEPFPNYQEMNI